MAREISSKSIDGITDLVVIAPIREGFIHAYENVTYATRLRIVAEALNRVRSSAREHETSVPFSDVTERILTLLDFRIGVLDKDLYTQIRQNDSSGDAASFGLEPRRYLYLTATFDTALEPYMRLIWDPLGPFLDLIFINCEGYVTAGDHSCEEFLDWVRANQVDSAIFYATSGNTIRDDLYHDKIERLLREVSRPQRELDLLREPTPSPDVDAARVRQAAMADLVSGRPDSLNKFFKLNELALEVLTVLYRLADFYPPEWLFTKHPRGAQQRLQEGKYLARVAHSILLGWNDNLIKADPAIEHAFAEPLEWYRTAMEPDKTGKVPCQLGREHPEDPAFVRSEVQGGIISPLGKDTAVQHGALLLMSIASTDPARAFLRQLPIHFEGDDEPADGLFRTIGFTPDGLKRIGLPRAVRSLLPREFREGMDVRAGLIGDKRENHPRRWKLPPRNWPPGGTDKRPAINLSEIDFIIQLRYAAPASDPSNNQPLLDEVARIAELAAQSGCVLIGYEVLGRLPSIPGTDGQFAEHFGFADGLSDPEIQTSPVDKLFDGEGETSTDPTTFGLAKPMVWNNKARLGEVLMGYRNNRGDFAYPADAKIGRHRKAARELTHNGSFLVVRKLEQHVAAFKSTMERESKRLAAEEHITIAPDQIAARIVGRAYDGKPLVASASGLNQFDYTGDAHGSACPFASHARRSNPRNFEHGRPSPRIVRRGMSFGPPYGAGEKPQTAPQRGLMFMCYQSSISEQFETIQRWINGGNSSGVSSSQTDPLLGIGPKADPARFGQERGEPRLFQFEWNNRVVRIEMPEPFVTLHWGLYLFVPSRAAIAKLSAERSSRSRAKREAADFDRPNAEEGNARIAKIEALSPELQRFEWKRLIEDFDLKDPAERAVSPDVWGAVRSHHGGSYRIDSGIACDREDRAAGTIGTAASQFGVSAAAPSVITATKDHALQVLSDWKRYSVREQLERFEAASGAIYVAQQPDDKYGSDRLDGKYNYKQESGATNAVLMAYREDEGFAAGYRAGKTVLGLAREGARHIKVSPPLDYIKLELRRQYLTPAIGLVCTEWFGLPDWDPFKEAMHRANPAAPGPESTPEAACMHNGPWNWKPAWPGSSAAERQRKPTCPGDCMSASRYAFYPRPTASVAMFGIDQGQAIKQAGVEYVRRHVANDTRPSGTLIGPMFDLYKAGTFGKGAKAEDVLARNLIGIMLGAIPPMEGSLRGILLEWLGERTIWRSQAAFLRAKQESQDPYLAAKSALEVPMTRAMCKRPAPDLLYRTATKNGLLPGTAGGPETRVRKGDTVVVNLAAAAQQSLLEKPEGPGDVSIIFGGDRASAWQGDYGGNGCPVDHSTPVHACPGRDLAMGAMYGILAALLDQGQIEALPASLIIKIKDW